MQSMAFVNQKGGVGKTTVALGLAAAASRAGRRVLLIDLDPQANATTGLGVWEPERTMEYVLAADGRLVAEILERSSWPDDDGASIPDVAASSPLLAQREPQLANDPIGAQDRLGLAMRGLDHDLVLIDCPPSLGLLTVNGLFAADRVVVVTEPAAWARDGVEQVLQTIERVSLRRPRPLEVAGVVVNRLGRTRDARYWNDQLSEDCERMLLPSIQLRAAVAEAAAQSLPLHALGARPGAPEATEQFAALLAAIESTDEASDRPPETHDTPEGGDDGDVRPATVPLPTAGH